MGNTADRITRLIMDDLGEQDEARHILDDALNGPGEPRRVARDALRGLGVQRGELISLELAHAADSRAEFETETRKMAVELQKQFAETFSGQGPPCRHIEKMKTIFWRTLSLSAVIPTAMFVLGGIALWLFTRGRFSNGG